MLTNPPAPPPIRPANLNQGPLSFSQESLWFLQQLDPENYAYNTTFIWKFTGGLRHDLLEQALNELILRHGPLRTIYPNRAGKPIQLVQPFERFPLPVVDLSALPEQERQPAVERYISKHGDRAFDLQHGPLIRAALLHISADEDYLFFGTHHISSDAWSRQVFLQDLLQVYDALRSGKPASLAEAPIQYLDYSIWQREWLSGENLTAYVEHWRALLSGDLPVLELPTDHPRPTLQSFRGARYFFQIPPTLKSRLQAFCQQERLTAFQVLLAAYALLLKRYTGQEDLIVGCPFANRSRPELDGLMGMFVNTLPIRIDLQGNPSTRELLAKVRAVMLDAFTWQAAPFEAIVSEISPQRDLSRTPVFQAVINMRNVPKRQASIEGLRSEFVLRESVPSPFDLALEFEDEGGTWNASLQYNADLFQEKTILRMIAHYQNLLGEILNRTDRPIAELDLLAPSERKRILIDWNDTSRPLTAGCVHDLISEQAFRNPDAVAVTCNGTSLTYAILERKANQLARFLQEQGVRPGARVGIYLPRSEKTAIVQLAILKAGAAFIPLDLSYPHERTAYLVNDCEPTAIITLTGLDTQLPGPVKKICLDAEEKAIEACGADALPAVAAPEMLAYIMYTSGSTGHPKGAMNTHRGIVNYLSHLRDQFQLGPSDRIIQLTPISFDGSVLEILGSLAFGGSGIMMDDSQMRDPEYILRAIIDNQATWLNLVPTMLRKICETALAGEFRKNSLRVVFPGGEVLRVADVQLARRALGDTPLFVNQYGPTECSVSQANFSVPEVIPDDWQVIPIGKPISNTRAYVLDEHLMPVPVGARGELFIGGVCVGNGYWNRPELTEERFLPDPFQPGERVYRTGDLVKQLPDGTLCFLGRSDHQVKIRGYRVELGEIESALLGYPGVSEAAVVLWQEAGQDSLAAYVTLAQGSASDIQKDLIPYLAGRLPFYMLPSALLVLEKMPHTPNQKIDRRALARPEGGQGQAGYLKPRNDLEFRLAALWQEVLEVERVGIRDNFFELGGHSLVAVRLFTRIEQEFGLSLPLLLLFQNGTVETLAVALAAAEKARDQEAVVTIQPHGNAAPLFILTGGVYMRDLALALGSSRPIYGLFPYQDGRPVFGASIEETARIYRQRLLDFHPQGPFLLLGHSAYGYFALELARQLGAEGKQVAFLGLLDTYAPGKRVQASLADRIKIHVTNLQEQDLAGGFRYVKQAARRLANRWRRIGLPGRTGVTREQEGKFKDIAPRLVGAYHPSSYDQPVTLFVAERRPWFMRWDPMAAWADILTGPVDVVAIPGDHMSMLKPPQAAVLAERLLAALNRNAPS